MKPAALLVFISDIHSLGLQTRTGPVSDDGLVLGSDDRPARFAKRFFDKMKREPTMDQAGYYSATTTYLKAVKAAGTTDSGQGHGGIESGQDQTTCSPKTATSVPTA